MTRRKGTDPTVDVKVHRENINKVDGDDMVPRIQTACVAAMVDLYDRYITRDDFMNMLGPLLMMYGQMAKIWQLDQVRDACIDEVLTLENIDYTIEQSKARAGALSEHIKEIMDRMAQLPTGRDTIQ